MTTASTTSARTRGWYVYVAFNALLLVAHATGIVGEWSELLVLSACAGSLAAIATGVRRHRLEPRLPWVLLSASFVLFAIGGTVREAVSAQVLVVVPVDVISVAGYAALATALILLLRARDPAGTGESTDAVLDAGLIALGVFAAAWAYMVAPALSLREIPLEEQLVLAAYPAASTFLLAGTARLALGSVPGRVAPAAMVLAAGTLLTADVLHAVVELGVLPGARWMVLACYLLAYAAFGAAVLHPSIGAITASDPQRRPTPSRWRLLTIAAALLLPGVVAVSTGGLRGADLVMVGLCTLALTSVVALRLLRAVDAQTAALERIRHQATHDQLTGLPNRAHLAAFLPAVTQRAYADGRTVALLFCDLDQFKVVNDSLGHTVGDGLLIAVARRLTEQLRPDDYLARIGGDEFVVVLPSVRDADDAHRVAHRLLSAFDAPFQIGASQLFTGTSIGVAVAEPGVTDTEALVREADAAMYEAKSRGRNGAAVFDASLGRRAHRRLELEAELRGAIGRGELQLAYQPLVSLADGRLEGFEALLRWQHPSLGLVRPDEFIPVAEETGLILEIGAWVLDQAGRQVSRWRGEPGGDALHVSVNVCARQIRGGNLVATVEEVLARHRLPGRALHIELTESAFLQDVGTTLETLVALRAAGLQIALDDFGTGYSSLAYLKRYPLDRIKIDRSFTADLDVPGSADAPLVAAIVAMAGALGMSTLAEGVETTAQRDRLRALGCGGAQGYLFAPPLPPTEAGALIGEALQRGLVPAV